MSRMRALVAGAVASTLVPALSVLPAPSAADPAQGPASARLDNPFLRSFEISFAQTIAFAGDVNGDGFDELLVAAPYWSGARSGGRVAMYAGSAAGLDPNPVVLAAPPDAYGFGLSMGSAGDVDGDGYDDVVVGMGHPGEGI